MAAVHNRSARRALFVALCAGLAAASTGCAQLGIETGPNLGTPVAVPPPPAPTPAPGQPAPAPGQAAPAADVEVVVTGRKGWLLSDALLRRINVTKRQVTWVGPKVDKDAQLTVVGGVVVATRGTSLSVVDLQSGQQRFTKTLTGPIETNCSPRRADPLPAQPRACVTVTGGIVAVRLSEAVVAYDVMSGAERWRTPLTRADGPLTGHGVVATVHRLKDDTPKLTLIDPATGVPQVLNLDCPPGPGRPRATPATQVLLASSGTTVTFGTGSSSGCLRKLTLPDFKDVFTLNGGTTIGVTGMGQLSLHGDLVARPFNPATPKDPAGITIIPPDGRPRIVQLPAQQSADDIGTGDGGLVPILVRELANPTNKSLLMANLANGAVAWSRPLTGVKQLEMTSGPVELRCPAPEQCQVTPVDRATGKPGAPVDLPPGVNTIATRTATHLVLSGRKQLSAVDPKTGQVVATYDFEG